MQTITLSNRATECLKAASSLLRSAPRASLALLVCLALPGAAYADGSAVFASVTNAEDERRLTQELEASLDTPIETSRAWVQETEWTRLHSPVMAESDARSLVARARAKGYTAWYNSSGNRWATSADQAPADDSLSRYQQNDDWRRDTDLGEVKTTTEDLSHLPMAETFPID